MNKSRIWQVSNSDPSSWHSSHQTSHTHWLIGGMSRVTSEWTPTKGLSYSFTNSNLYIVPYRPSHNLVFSCRRKSYQRKVILLKITKNYTRNFLVNIRRRVIYIRDYVNHIRLTSPFFKHLTECTILMKGQSSHIHLCTIEDGRSLISSVPK